jgi:coproporphyrinogen III oxidase-like Fe-S oxidoreductase
MKKTAAGDWSACEEEVLSAEKKETESFLLALRTSEGAAEKKFARFLGKRKKSAGSLRENGLIESKNGKITLTERGQLFAETVFSEFASD